MFQTQHGANLAKHLSIHHPQEYKNVCDQNESGSSSHSTPLKKSEDTLNILSQECVKLVAIHGRPLSLIDDEAFQKILSLVPVKVENENKKINSYNIRDQVVKTAYELRTELANELRGKFISLKVDIASISTRGFMGVNLQFIQNGRIILRNIGLIELHQSHTSEYLKEKLLFILTKFRIDTNQIYSITTDNGANMIKMGRLMNVLDDPSPGSSNNTGLTSESDEENDGDININESEIEARLEEITNFEYCFGIIRPHICIVKCAAHTLQLAVNDACKNPEIQLSFASARRIIKKLRTPTYSMALRAENKNKPILDCPTRWNSTIDMIESLFTLKDICSSDPRNLFLPDSTWKILEEIVAALKPAKKLMIKLQSEQLTVGDCYLSWMTCKLETSDLNTTLANEITSNIENRESMLFNSEAFINAMIMDPRINSTLKIDQQQAAKSQITSLYTRLLKFYDFEKSNDHIDTTEVTDPPDEYESDKENINSVQTKLRDFLNTSYMERHDNISTLLQPRLGGIIDECVQKFKEALSVFLEEPLLDCSADILKFWEHKKEKYPSLYKVAKIVLATPVTEVSVERLFSSMKFVVSDLRLNLKDDIIEDILFIRSNHLHKKYNN